MRPLQDLPITLPLLAGGLLLTAGCENDDDDDGGDLEVAVGEWNLTHVAYSSSYGGQEYTYEEDFPSSSTYYGCTYVQSGRLVVEADRTGIMYMEFSNSCYPDYEYADPLPFTFVDIPGDGFQLDFTGGGSPTMDCSFDASLIVCSWEQEITEYGATYTYTGLWTFERS